MLLTIATYGKNDNYAGNFVQRLEFNLCKLVENIDRLGIQDDVEIIVTDWGSTERLSDFCKVPKRDYLKFLYVPQETCNRCVPDSKFSIPHALNAAARRMNGDNLLCIDSDTYISFEGFSGIYNLLKNNKQDYVYYWSSRYHIPYNVQSRMRNIQEMDLMLDEWIELGKPLVNRSELADGFFHDEINLDDFLGCACALLLDKRLVFESSLLYEKLTKWGWMDIEIYKRLRSYNYLPLGDLESVLNSNFYHIGHHEITTGNHVNGSNDNHVTNLLHANSDNWGMVNESLELKN
jgi:hypothetical protein